VTDFFDLHGSEKTGTLAVVQILKSKESVGISTCSSHRSRKGKEKEITNPEPGAKITKDEKIAWNFDLRHPKVGKSEENWGGKTNTLVDEWAKRCKKMRETSSWNIRRSKTVYIQRFNHKKKDRLRHSDIDVGRNLGILTGTRWDC